MKYKDFQEKMHGCCRKCINEKLGIHFTSADCEYWEYPEPCVSCGKVKNIVTGISFTKRWRLWAI